MNFISTTAIFLMILAIVSYSQIDRSFHEEESALMYREFLVNMRVFQNKRAISSYNTAYKKFKKKNRGKNDSDESQVAEEISFSQFCLLVKGLLRHYYGGESFFYTQAQFAELILDALLKIKTSDTFIIKSSGTEEGHLAYLTFDDEELQKRFYLISQGKRSLSSSKGYPAIGSFLTIFNGKLCVRYKKENKELIQGILPEVKFFKP